MILKLKDGRKFRVISPVGSNDLETRDLVIQLLMSRVLEAKVNRGIDSMRSEVRRESVEKEVYGLREAYKEDGMRGGGPGGTEPTGTRKTMRECMSRSQSILWDGKLK